MVSREDHCLSDLLWRWRNGELGGDVVAVVSNHPDHAEQVAALGLPFHFVPVEPEARAEAERQVLELLGEVDLLVLARYMQVLSAEFLDALGAPAINIHHSFLPAFVGADPYRRAHERGVKLIGATAHYVTPELDAGPIIDQDVTRVSHSDEVEDLVADRPRHRAAGAGPGGYRPPRRPGPARRRADGGLLSRRGGSRRAPTHLPGCRPPATPTTRSAFIVGAARRYGDLFSVRFPYFGRVNYLASPALVKEVFGGDPAVFHAGEANATVLEPTLGPRSVLNLDDEPHMRARKLLLPPFHGERLGVYGELMVEATRREMASWPVGEPFALLPHTQRITLTVILRAVFGITDEARIARAAALINRFTTTASPITKFPILRRDSAPAAPGAASPAPGPSSTR